MPQQPQVSTNPRDPNFGLPVAAAPSTNPRDPNFGLQTPPPPGPGGGRGGGPGAAPPQAGGRGGRPAGAVQATPPPPRSYPGGWRAAAQDFGGMVGGGLAATAAAAALPVAAPVAGVAATARMLPWAARLASGAAGVAGAGAGGAAAAAATGSPLDIENPGGETGDEDSVVAAFKRQAETEAIGLGTGWAINSIGRRMIAGTVARNAVRGLQAAREATLLRTRSALDRSQDLLRQHAALSAAEAESEKVLAGNAASQRKQAVEFGQVQRQAVGEQWPQSEAAIQPGAGGGPAAPPGAAPARMKLPQPSPLPAQHISAQLEARDAALGWTPPAAPVRPIPAHATPPPPGPNFPAQAAGNVAKAVQPHARGSLRMIGEAVGAAAESGPPVPTAELRARLSELSDQMTPSVLQPGAGTPTLTTASGHAIPLEQAKALLAKNPDFAEALGQIPPELQLPAALSYAHDVVRSGETIPFADAHKLKRLLDEVVSWDRGAKKMRESATKGFRQTLRSAMASTGHAPYEQATQAYKETAQLFSPNQLGAQITKLVQGGNPEKVVNSLVKVTEPTKLRMLKEVLMHHAGQGGGTAGAAAGQHAWDTLRSSIMYKRLIQPGLENFEASVAKMHPEFRQLLIEDGPGREVYLRLHQMADALAQVKAQTSAAVGAARGAEQAARTRQAAVESRGAVQRQALTEDRVAASRAHRDAHQPTAAERAFDQSSLAGTPPPAQVGSELAYAAGAPVGSPRQVAGAARLMLKGPKVNDLIQWASMSPTATQAVVRAVTGPRPGQAIAALIRLHEWMGAGEPPELRPAHTPGIPPPPGPRSAAPRR